MEFYNRSIKGLRAALFREKYLKIELYAGIYTNNSVLNKSPIQMLKSSKNQFCCTISSEESFFKSFPQRSHVLQY